MKNKINRNSITFFNKREVKGTFCLPWHDIRDWDPEHQKMGKGVTLTEEELKKLKEVLSGIRV